jgi:hypothetical protein
MKINHLTQRAGPVQNFDSPKQPSTEASTRDHYQFIMFEKLQQMTRNNQGSSSTEC